jgi:hypothetical protein
MCWLASRAAVRLWLAGDDQGQQLHHQQRNMCEIHCGTRLSGCWRRAGRHRMNDFFV